MNRVPTLVQSYRNHTRMREETTCPRKLAIIDAQRWHDLRTLRKQPTSKRRTHADNLHMAIGYMEGP